jgi:hypothetical protein
VEIGMDDDPLGIDEPGRWLALRRRGLRVIVCFDERPVRVVLPDLDPSARLLLASNPAVRLEHSSDPPAPASLTLPGASVAVLA